MCIEEAAIGKITRLISIESWYIKMLFQKIILRVREMNPSYQRYYLIYQVNINILFCHTTSTVSIKKITEKRYLELLSYTIVDVLEIN